jgi:Domain of unknown function (DUF4124)
MNFKIASRTLLLALASSSFALAAMAQWQWIDNAGHKVFSDRAPPADIGQKNILKQPGGKVFTASPPSDNTTAVATPRAASSAGKASAPKLSGKDTQLEARKKQADDEEIAKKKADEEKLASARADNCERAKKGLAAVQSGVRLSSTNAKGEREFMSDEARLLEAKHLHGIADSDCQQQGLPRQ